MTAHSHSRVTCPICDGRGTVAHTHSKHRRALAECKACRGYGVIARSYIVKLVEAQQLARKALGR
jgi:DnaJ-class molecular chaperone